MSNLSCLYAPWDNCGKITSETTALGKRHVGYAYVEIAGFSGQAPEAYGQFFWEQKFWESPVFIHAEYRAVAANAFYEGTDIWAVPIAFTRNMATLPLNRY